MNSDNEYEYIAFTHKSNYSFKAMNRLLAGNYEIFWLKNPYHEGDLYLDAGDVVAKIKLEDPLIDGIVQDLGLDIRAIIDDIGIQPLFKINQPKTGIYKSWVPSSDEGWTRYVLDEYEFPFSSVSDSMVQAGKLHRKYDVIILPDLSASAIKSGHNPGKMPPKYCGGLGNEGINSIKEFVKTGGMLIGVNSAIKFIVDEFNIPIKIAYQEDVNKFWAPGPILSFHVNNSNPIGFGLPEKFAMVFTNCPLMEMKKGDVVARYAEENILISGALFGQDFLSKKPLVFQMRYGKGKIILFGFRPVFRAQTRQCYKLLFNAIFFANAKDVL
jgi:hypothetical protein